MKDRLANSINRPAPRFFLKRVHGNFDRLFPCIAKRKIIAPMDIDRPPTDPRRAARSTDIPPSREGDQESLVPFRLVGHPHMAIGRWGFTGCIRHRA